MITSPRTGHLVRGLPHFTDQAVQWNTTDRKEGPVTESIWAAVKPGWHADADCRDVPSEIFFPEQEDEQALALAKSYCNVCPVRNMCLRSALAHSDEGLWAGTTTAQRHALRRVRDRAKCPVCTATQLVRLKDGNDVVTHEVCVGCGVSWRAERRPTENGRVPAPAPAPVKTVVVNGDKFRVQDVEVAGACL
jgi:Zn ribbon nucleic-acid-binding protein